MLNLTLERIERRIRNLPVEHVYVLAPDNSILFHHTDNLPDQVAFPFQAFAQVDVGIVTHNHPGGRSFSRIDVRMARKADLRELRVVTNRHRYSLQPPPEGWHSVSLEEFDRAVERERLLLNAVLYDEIARQAQTRSMADEVAPHRLWERIAGIGLIRYSVETW